MANERGGKRAAPSSYNPKRTFIAYLACVCCGHWRPVSKVHLKQLLDPAWFLCPFCAEGRKRICDTWGGKTRTILAPAMLDIRVVKEPKEQAP